MLTKKYGMSVAGCGCHESPYLDDVSKKSVEHIDAGFYGDSKSCSDVLCSEIQWIDPSDDYYWDKYHEAIKSSPDAVAIVDAKAVFSKIERGSESPVDELIRERREEEKRKR